MFPKELKKVNNIAISKRPTIVWYLDDSILCGDSVLDYQLWHITNADLYLLCQLKTLASLHNVSPVALLAQMLGP